MAVDHVLGKIKEGKKLSTEEVLVLYLGTIVNELKDVRSGVARQRNCLREKIFKSPFSLYLERPVAQRSRAPVDPDGRRQGGAPTRRAGDAVDSHPGDSPDETPGACIGRSRVQEKPAHKSRRADP